MSYTRGKIYSWRGVYEQGDYIAIWSNDKLESDHKRCGYRDGVFINSKIFDEIVVMRFAEMTIRQRSCACKRAVKM